MQDRPLGMYRALVTSVNDPTGRGRIRTQCPQIAGSAELRWAEPVNPKGIVPNINSIVWISFSGGDITKPTYFTNQAGPSLGQTTYLFLANSINYTNTTTLTPVTDITTTLAANARYLIDGFLSYTGQTFAGGPGDLKVDWTVPSGATFRWSRNGYPSNTTNITDTVETDHSTIRALGTFGTATNVTASICGAVTTTAGGQLQMRAAQNSSTGVATTLRLRSWVRLTRIR